ncbi:hypothetical protein NEHOM01_0653 [Nematocida homosporus]|uniref:uncharacterized protein n=1 Tax=Nematocida homosporus TaxID=1912981 RepID=UPI00221EA89D|nr:uncharacterized protein NEHOM01_0653 [Nematocida homosporus]KAI5185148.1 hypothetical protein NEHOM01_0653 [Nematocida homosporus]
MENHKGWLGLFQAVFCALGDIIVLNESQWNRYKPEYLHPINIRCIEAFFSSDLDHNLIRCPLMPQRFLAPGGIAIHPIRSLLITRLRRTPNAQSLLYGTSVVLFYYYIAPLCVWFGGRNCSLSLYSLIFNGEFTRSFFYLFKGVFHLMWIWLSGWIAMLGLNALKSRYTGDHLVVLFQCTVDRSLKNVVFCLDCLFCVCLALTAHSIYFLNIADSFIVAILSPISILLVAGFVLGRLVIQFLIFWETPALIYKSFIWIAGGLLSFAVFFHLGAVYWWFTPCETKFAAHIASNYH